MEKNNNNTNYEKSITGEKVGEGEPAEEITKDQWTKSYIMAVKKYHKVIKMNLIQNAPKGSEEEVPVNQVSKIQIQGEVVPPVDDVTKYGPVDGDPIIEKKRFRLIKT